MQNDIRRLEISMLNSASVSVVNPFGNICKQRQYFMNVRFGVFAFEMLQVLAKCAIWLEFGHQKHSSFVRSFVITE
jgi:hypothetical protein